MQLSVRYVSIVYCEINSKQKILIKHQPTGSILCYIFICRLQTLGILVGKSNIQTHQLYTFYVRTFLTLFNFSWLLIGRMLRPTKIYSRRIRTDRSFLDKSQLVATTSDRSESFGRLVTSAKSIWEGSSPVTFNEDLFVWRWFVETL